MKNTDLSRINEDLQHIKRLCKYKQPHVRAGLKRSLKLLKKKNLEILAIIEFQKETNKNEKSFSYVFLPEKMVVMPLSIDQIKDKLTWYRHHVKHCELSNQAFSRILIKHLYPEKNRLGNLGCTTSSESLVPIGKDEIRIEINLRQLKDCWQNSDKLLFFLGTASVETPIFSVLSLKNNRNLEQTLEKGIFTTAIAHCEDLCDFPERKYLENLWLLCQLAAEDYPKLDKFVKEQYQFGDYHEVLVQLRIDKEADKRLAKKLKELGIR